MLIRGTTKKHIQIGLLIVVGLLMTFAAVSATSSKSVMSSDLVITEVCSHNDTVIYDSVGRYNDYVELYNKSDEVINLADYFLSDGVIQYDIGSVDVEPGTYELIFLDPEITELQIGDNDVVYLSDRYGNAIDAVSVPVVGRDKVYAKNAVSAAWENNQMPTPGEENRYTVETDMQLVGADHVPRLSAQSGFYEEDFYLEITAPMGYDIYYTIDGTEPTRESIRYTDPIYLSDASKNPNVYSVIEESYTWDEKGDMPDFLVDKCNIIRAVAVSEEGFVSEEAIGSYFIGFQNKKGYDKTYTLSLITNPENLFSNEHGIFVGGKLLEDNPMEDESRPYRAIANYSGEGKGWHREAYVELFDSSGEKMYSQALEIGIHGNYTKAYPQKALNLFADTPDNPSGYVFEGLFGGKNRSLMLRPGGANDCKETQFRDALNHRLAESRNITVLNAVPCQVFIDGEYWGLYNLQERIDQGLLAKEYGIDEEDVIVIKMGGVISGTVEYYSWYKEAWNLAATKKMTKDDKYRQASEAIDFQSFIDYYCFQIYVAACDQISNNVSVWRSKTVSDKEYGDGRWRWIIYDMDDSLGVMEEYTRYDVDSFTAGHMDGKPMSDQLLCSLLKNEEFKSRFVETFYQMEDEIFNPTYVNGIIDELVNEYMDAAILSHKRWHKGEYTEADYLAYVDVVRGFFEKRRPYIEKHMKAALELE